MPVETVVDQPWSRKHDLPGVPVVDRAARTVFPRSLEELIGICRSRQPADRLRAAGSHWALSEAAISDRTFIETNDPDDAHGAMARTLFNVVGARGCLNPAFVQHLANLHPRPFDRSHAVENEGTYLVHVETGKRIYQLYAELDLGHDDVEESLASLLAREHGNHAYQGPWAFQTLGGAGGQTVFGALTTGTHGGDFRFPPIADCVEAMHLVVDGGKHYWIEPTPLSRHRTMPITDQARLEKLFGARRFGGPENFEVIRDDDVFDAVLVGAGRFGVVYSVVLQAVRQYSLHERRRFGFWETIKGDIANPESDLWRAPADEGVSRFLQIAVCPAPISNFGSHRCGITKRWNVPLAGNLQNPTGRFERRGDAGPLDPRTGSPRFTRAGKSHAYSPDPDHPGAAMPASFLERACANANFMAGILQSVGAELGGLLDNMVSGTVAQVAQPGPAGDLSAAPSWFKDIFDALQDLLRRLTNWPGTPRLGAVLDDVRGALFDNPAWPRLAAVFVWQLIAAKLFESMQAEHDYDAISYAVMDLHDYLDQGCNVNVESIEVFFDAADPRLLAFVDALLAFEIRQEHQGRVFLGYISLRFTGPTRALLGMERFPRTCAVEVAGLADVVGTKDTIDFALALARDPNFRGILHWGQRHDQEQAVVQDRFRGDLDTWRAVLARFTDNGRLDRFTSAFTRRTGLEIMTPTIEWIRPRLVHSVVHGQPRVELRVAWDCSHNPPETEVLLHLTPPVGPPSIHRPYPLAGERSLVDQAAPGRYVLRLVAVIRRNGEARQTSSTVVVDV